MKVQRIFTLFFSFSGSSFISGFKYFNSSYRLIRLTHMIVSIGIALMLGTCNKQPYSAKVDYHPPKTAKSEEVYSIHGIEIKDPFRWLENVESDTVKEWIRTQERTTYKYLNQLQETSAWIKVRMEKLSKESNEDPPVITGSGSFFFVENNYKKSHPILKYKEQSDSPERILIDPNNYDSKTEFSLVNFIPSPDGSLLAYNLKKGSSRYNDWRIMDVKTSKDLNDNIISGSLNRFSWLPDGSGFIYRTFAVSDRQDEQFIPHTYVLKLHKIGQPLEMDAELYRANSKTEFISGALSKDGEFLIVFEGNTSQNVYLVEMKNLGRSPLLIFNGQDTKAGFQFIHSQKNKFWFLSNEKADNGKVVEVSLHKESQLSIKELISESSYSINQAFFFGQHFVVHSLFKAKPFLQVFSREGILKKEMALPVGLTWSSFTPIFQQGISGHQDHPWVYVRSQGLTASNTVYRYQINTGEFQEYSKSNTGFDIEKYETQQVFFTSKDGTEVPMFITHKKGLKLDGTNPTLLYVYGAWGWTALPFIGRKYALFLEQGGVHAMPNIRGGGALGQEWYEQGRGRNKGKGIEDALAAAEWLINEGYSSPKKLIIEGNSAGGIVAAAAINQKPELFKVGWLEFSAFDLPRVMKFRGGSGWKSQFGDPDKEEDLKALMTYSPYHNVNYNRNYPHILIAVGEKDPIAAPHHSYKMLAALQQNLFSNPTPSLLWINWGGGHGGRNEEERTALRIAELTFAFHAMKIKPFNN